jgi:hypothetical protein
MNELAVFINGVRWVPFSVEFKTDEGRFSFELYAVNAEHAAARLEDLKATAKVAGEIVGRTAA